MSDSTRTATPIDVIAEGWVDDVSQMHPTVATYIGRSQYDDRYGDYSPDGAQEEVDRARMRSAQLAAETPADQIDAVTREDLQRELALTQELFDAGAHLRDLNVIASPVQDVREAFDLMPTATDEDWRVIAARLGAVPEALAGYRRSLQEGIARSVVPARRQVVEVAAQIDRHTAADGFFADFAAAAAPAEGTLPESLRGDLHEAAQRACIAYDELADFLRTQLAPAAGDHDGVGRDLYGLFSRQFLGAAVDLDETYAWGLEELARMRQEQQSAAAQIVPSGTVEDAVAHLEADPAHRLHGTAALQEWMQRTADAAVEALAHTHFDIPEPIRRIECRIAPTQEGGIYYTGPTDDFSRPGRMWWSVPAGVEEFDTWRELTTVYHEGVPGHHLQIAQAVYNRSSLNSWRRLLAGTSGHAEGWALYAERLMEQLGFLDDPADRLGMLDGQRMRAARVVLDIGVHLGKPRPDGNGTWDAEYALAFMRENVNMSDEFIRFEVNRYLGWPGQAPSYKVGQRIWEQLRDDSRRREGADFDIKRFHRRALDLGGVGLDTLRWALSAQA